MLKHRWITKGSMKKILSLLTSLILLTSCAESIALLGTSASNGKIVQSTFNSAVSYGIKKQTGKSPMQHAMVYVEKHNPEKKKSNCVAFLKSTESEVCEAVKKNILETKEYFKNKQKIFVRSKIENLARESDIYNRR